ncbi:hypothetical protein L914_14490 [Phytophthora nicotianae]|uniref:Uncharacterized protein n=2 Tax=Phytophthora nicotianae TaxID=4792 RepID=W2MSP0_PHYNI|nr:hypothetical protein L914_14490 [Phytophthora nicotianae]ETO59168.1 hypothetical protein F444_22457 [Phytophthora nicotianae P1976]
MSHDSSFIGYAVECSGTIQVKTANQRHQGIVRDSSLFDIRSSSRTLDVVGPQKALVGHGSISGSVEGCQDPRQDNS